MLEASHLNSEIINDNIVKGTAKERLQLCSAPGLGHDGTQRQAVTKSELCLPTAIQWEPGAELCLNTAGTKPASRTGLLWVCASSLAMYSA